MRAALLLALVALVAACGGAADDERAAGASRELVDVAQLEAAFAADKGTPRLVLLLSPT